MFDVIPVTTPHATACGAACLRMLLTYYGIDVPLDQLIRECGVGVAGATAGDLKRCGNAHGLDVKAWSMTAEDLYKIDRPAIIWWRYHHFCVYCGLNDQGEPVICNPSRSRYGIDRGSFAALYTGVALTNGEPEDLRMTASENHSTGEVFEEDSLSLRALAPIARGETLRAGVNCEAVNLVDIVNEINQEE